MIEDQRNDWDEPGSDPDFDSDFESDSHDATDTLPCPECGASIYAEADRCPNCCANVMPSAVASGAEGIAGWKVALVLLAALGLLILALVP